MDCPNYESCAGELHFSVSPVWQGEGVWNTYMGQEAECVEQTCDCELTGEQWDDLLNDAIENPGLVYEGE
jgi:hypothetical protein